MKSGCVSGLKCDKLTCHMDIELFGGPLDDFILEHEVESEQELIDKPWIAIVAQWVKPGGMGGDGEKGNEESSYIYKYVGGGYAMFDEIIYEESAEGDEPSDAAGQECSDGGASRWN